MGAPFLKHEVSYALVFGQIISALIAGTGVFSTYLAKAGVNIPTSQSFFNYAALAVLYGAAFLRQGGKWDFSRLRRLSSPWWVYALLAVADVEANFFVVKAYQYTSITSVMLIDCWTIPCVMGLSYCFLKQRFTRRQMASVGLCLVGLGVLVLSDALHEDSGSSGGSGGSNSTALLTSARQALTTALSSSDSGASSGPPRPVLGDLLCLLGATLYAVSNVGQEAMVKHIGKDRVEYLAMLGCFGTLVCGVQALALEHEQLSALSAQAASSGWYMAGFVGCLFAMYSLTAAFLQRSDATVFNLSLLTSDVWAILASIALFNDGIQPLYFVAFGVIIAGVFLYNTSAPVKRLASIAWAWARCKRAPPPPPPLPTHDGAAAAAAAAGCETVSEGAAAAGNALSTPADTLKVSLMADARLTNSCSAEQLIDVHAGPDEGSSAAAQEGGGAADSTAGGPGSHYRALPE